jgi:hypothetical protein
MTTRKITVEDLEWEDPAPSRSGGGMGEKLATQIGEMRAALTARRGNWAVLDTFEKDTQASAFANQLSKRRNERDDSRLLGIEFAGRKMLDGGSKLYVRAV